MAKRTEGNVDYGRSPDKEKENQKRTKIQRIWQLEEVVKVLNYLQKTVREGKLIEKPTADKYYLTMLAVLNISDCSISQLKSKVKNVKKKYTDVVQWRNQTGQGVLESEGQLSFEKVTEARCPHFVALDEIFGTRTSINPPFVIGSNIPSHNKASSLTEQDIEDGFSASTSDLRSTTTVNPTSDLVAGNPASGSTAANSTNTNSTTSVNSKGSLGRFQTSMLGGATALAEARNLKTESDNKRIQLEISRLEFEKDKWKDEMEVKRRQLDLEERRLTMEESNSRFEIELKYKTQLELTKPRNS